MAQAPGQGPARVVPPGHAPKPVLDGRATLVGPFKPDQMLRLVVGLQHPHAAEEEQFLHDIQTKDSLLFHHFLTAEEWNARFAPSAQDEQAVVDWAESRGLKVTHRYPNRLLVDLEGNVSTIQAALKVAINTYVFQAESRFSNDRDPEIPQNLVNIIHSLGGLNNIQVMHPHHIGAKQTAYPIYVPGDVVSSGPSGGHDGDRAKLSAALKGSHHSAGATVVPNITNGNYDPTDIYSSEAYDTNALDALGHCCNPLHAADAPPEASIAIATAGTQNGNDFTGFHNQYSYLADHWFTHNIDGTGACCDLEGTMDFEWSTAMANSFGSFHDTATVHMYDGVNANFSTFTDIYNQMLTDGSARVMSTSWGCAEVDCADSSTMDTQDGIFASMVGQGWSLFAASDDTGAVAKNGSGSCVTHDAVDFPASDPHVVGVGGTTLSLDFFGNYLGEVAWTGGTGAGSCNSNNGGSGGGCSVHFLVPSYQPNNSTCSVTIPFFGTFYYRQVPDIALNASVLQNIFFGGVLQGNGGTSIASPEMAGFYAQSNAYLLSLGNICGIGNGTAPCAPQGDPHHFIYGLAQTAPHYPFYDITSGCNSNDVTAANNLNFFCAGAGYDLVTGWGSINMLQMAWAMNWSTVAGFGAPTLSFAGPAVNQWYNTDQEVSWALTPHSANSFPSSGIAGFTQGWDSIPSDPTREATPGSGNSFYSGPQFPNATTGCLSLAGGFGCAGGVSQGFHTAHVQTWDNEGSASGDLTYGPVGYDTIPPFTLYSQSPGRNFFGWNNTTVQVTLSASDPGAPVTGSGVSTTYASVDNGFCSTIFLGSCFVYGGPFNITAQGAHTVYFFSRDVAGNFELRNTTPVNIDETAPVTTGSLSGTLNGSVYVSPVKVTLSASDNLSGVASTVFQINGGVLQVYGGPFMVANLGVNTVTFHSTDRAGNVEATKSMSFTIKGATSTSVTSSKNPSILGSAVTFTATVASTVGTATGSVTFKDGATTLGSAALSGGVATFTTAALSVGSHSITVVYGGAANFFGSTSPALTQHVVAATSTVLAASVNPSVFGQAVTFTATVTSATPGTITGTVTFKNGAVVLGTGAVSGGHATFSTSGLTVGIHSMSAIYSGNATFATSTSPALSHTVNKAASSTVVSSSHNPSVFGQSVTFTATVTAVAPGSGTPTGGTVTFKNGTTVLGSGGLVSGKATFAASSLTVGAHSITATYNGGTAFNPSTSAVLTQTVNKAATLTTLTSSPNPSTLGTTVTFKVTVAAVAPGSGTPGGTVTLKDGTATLGSAALVSGKATFATSLLTHGSHSMTVLYGGSATYLGGTSAVVTQKVN
jgi:hypothetical protein